MISLRQQASKLPMAPGVYIFKNSQGRALYVGKSTNVRERIFSHLASKGEKEQAMAGESATVESITVGSELEALLLEAELIKQYLPRYNSRSKDDKHALYIKITKSKEFPKVFTSRKEDDPKAVYFGPFPSSSTVRRVLKMIRKVFPFCQQPVASKRPCLYSHLGLCNPCPSEIIQTQGLKLRRRLKRDYRSNLANIARLLSGKQKLLKGKLKREMTKAVRGENFEIAARIRDQLVGLEYITTPYKSPREYLENPNLIEDIRKGEMDALYELLGKSLRMKYPSRVECFDISHLGGKAATASLVAFVNGEPEKSLYRKFKIHRGKTMDDFAMIKETVGRRLNHLKDWGEPALLIVDGGKGQVSAARSALAEKGIELPIVGLAKRLEEVIIPKSFGFYTVRLGQDNPALHLLQRARDEAHRFARKYHFQLRMHELKSNLPQT